jgi:hypothetical protein
MQTRSEITISRWKKRISELVDPDSAQVLAAFVPELHEFLGVNIETDNVESGLDPAKAEVRLSSILTKMFATFAVRNNVRSMSYVLIEALYHCA